MKTTRYAHSSSRTSSPSADSNENHDQDMRNKEMEDEQPAFSSGSEKFQKLGWAKLTVCLIVEAIALGALSIPSVFATVGMIPGILLTVGLGLTAIYSSYVVGQVKIKYPQVEHYSDAVRLIWGKFGYELSGAMFALYLAMVVGSHALTGTIAWIKIIDQPQVCALVWSIISAIILFVLALPPTFSEFAILGYIDFVSIVAAILITIVATGVNAHTAPGGLAAVDWSLWAPEGLTVYEAFLATTNVVFAYSFTVCQFSFMSEMHRPKDYVKSIWALGLIEIFIYTLSGALIYAFVGSAVQSPALLSASPLMVRVTFAVALPVIFISGSINGTVVCRYILDRVFAKSEFRYINNRKGWIVWSSLIGATTIFGWVIAEAVPFFSALLGLISALFISGFSYYWPALFWFQLIKKGKWYKGMHNISLSMINLLVFIIGILVLGLGTYASVQEIINKYTQGKVRGPFSCDSSAY